MVFPVPWSIRASARRVQAGSDSRGATRGRKPGALEFGIPVRCVRESPHGCGARRGCCHWVPGLIALACVSHSEAMSPCSCSLWGSGKGALYWTFVLPVAISGRSQVGWYRGCSRRGAVLPESEEGRHSPLVVSAFPRGLLHTPCAPPFWHLGEYRRARKGGSPRGAPWPTPRA